MPSSPPLPPSSALSLRLAADPRLSETDYVDDQIWELSLAGGEPSALALETTFGLRARAMRIFPSFRWKGDSRMDPETFTRPPRVELALPNYLRVRFDPFVDLQVLAEYWARGSKIVSGRLTLFNGGDRSDELRLRLHALLRPDEGGAPMAESLHSGVSVLAGQTGDLTPLLFLSGGAVADAIAHPALSVTPRMQPGRTHEFLWALAGLSTAEDGFAAARETVGLDWEKEIAKAERANGRWIQVESGNADWDAALAMTQKVGLGCLVSGTPDLPHTSYVLHRGPDDGYSVGGGGRDYEAPWAGQDPFAAFYLGRQLLPIAPREVSDWLRNFLHTQLSSGEIDGRPGLAGQRGGWLCAPLLATLTLATHRHTESRALLREAFDPLRQFFASWFRQRHDRDGDGAPEWEHPLQTGNPSSPSFVPWAKWGQGLDLKTVEHPDLIAYLLRECQSLVIMAKELGRTEALPDLEAKATGLRRALERAWIDDESRFGLLDRDLHVALEGDELGSGKGEFTLTVGTKFDPMARLVVRVEGPEEASRSLRVTIHGRGPKGQFRTERIDEHDFRWFWELGTATSDGTFASVDRVEVRGVSEAFSTHVHIADHTRGDLPHLLPLWAGEVRESRAHAMVEERLLGEGYWLRHGLASCPATDPAYAPAERPEACGVQMLWNELLGEALLAAGRREQAAELVARLLAATSGSLAREGSFRAIYDPENGRGVGERDSVFGLAPLNLFLQVLGIRLISPWALELVGANPFPEPVTVRWRGLTVLRRRKGPTLVTFPDGRQCEVRGEELQRVEARR